VPTNVPAQISIDKGDPETACSLFLENIRSFSITHGKWSEHKANAIISVANLASKYPKLREKYNFHVVYLIH